MMSLLRHRRRRPALSPLSRGWVLRSSVNHTLMPAVMRELVAPGAVGGGESEWESRVRRAMALIPLGGLPSFYLLRSGTTKTVIPLTGRAAPLGFSPEEIASQIIAEDACTAVPLGRRDGLRASASSGAATLPRPDWVWPVRNHDRLLGFWIGAVGPNGDPHLLAQLEELNHWIATAHELVGAGRVEPVPDSNGAAPLARWLAADSLMSLCTLAFSDFRDVHGLSRLLIVAHAGGGLVGWALMPRDEHVRFLDEWLAECEREPVTQERSRPSIRSDKSARILEIDSALYQAGFRAGAPVETGRNTSYCAYWGHGSAAGTSDAGSASTGDVDDLILQGPLWSQLQVALSNMARMEYLRELSHIDSITRVFNRRYFNLRLTEETSRARRSLRSLSLLVFDIDHFKELNDSLGHQAGDTILRRLAEYVRWTMRSTDLLCRLSGDEFAILMPDTDADDCLRFGERLRLSLRNRRFTADTGFTAVPVEISIGGAVFPRHADHAESLLWCADMALLAAKQQGRNRFILYDPSLSGGEDAW